MKNFILLLVILVLVSPSILGHEGEGEEEKSNDLLKKDTTFFDGKGIEKNEMMYKGMHHDELNQVMMHTQLSNEHGGMIKMMDGFGMSFYWLLNLALGAFIVGIIFWWTKKLVLGKR
jgi:hypothetical protein